MRLVFQRPQGPERRIRVCRIDAIGKDYSCEQDVLVFLRHGSILVISFSTTFRAVALSTDLLQNGGTRASAVRSSVALTARLGESRLLKDGDPGLLGDARNELLGDGLEQSRLAGAIAPDKGRSAGRP